MRKLGRVQSIEFAVLLLSLSLFFSPTLRILCSSFVLCSVVGFFLFLFFPPSLYSFVLFLPPLFCLFFFLLFLSLSLCHHSYSIFSLPKVPWPFLSLSLSLSLSLALYRKFIRFTLTSGYKNLNKKRSFPLYIENALRRKETKNFFVCAASTAFKRTREWEWVEKEIRTRKPLVNQKGRKESKFTLQCFLGSQKREKS